MKFLLLNVFAALLVAGSIAGCKPAPREADASAPVTGAPERVGTPINYGQDTCAYRTDHVITRVRHGAEIIEKSGEVHKFCSTECMIAFHLKGNVAEEDVAEWLVVDFAKSRALLDATRALYIHTNLLPSPGGMGISALKDEQIAKTTHFAYAGDIIGWEEVVEVVRRRIE